ncbi:12070_t:CDS:2, partial [Entrophospora sp. SA101]
MNLEPLLKNVKFQAVDDKEYDVEESDIEDEEKQISHHPPVSAFCYHSEDKGITACGVDQLSARFTRTSVKIGPGEQNKGIYINLSERRNEEYLLTHSVASVQDWLKAPLYVVVAGSCIVTCPKTKLKAVLEYKEE